AEAGVVLEPVLDAAALGEDADLVAGAAVVAGEGDHACLDRVVVAVGVTVRVDAGVEEADLPDRVDSPPERAGDDRAGGEAVRVEGHDDALHSSGVSVRIVGAGPVRSTSSASPLWSQTVPPSSCSA